MGENLIFLISQPRAGSTMLQKILGAHPEIHTVSEPWLALRPLFALREEGSAADYDTALGRRAVRDFLGHLPEGEQAYWEGVRLLLNHLYGRALEATGKRIFLDKTPRYYFVIPELRRVFPGARFVFLLRNPLAVLSSILENWIRSDDPWQLRNSRHDLMAAPRLLLEGIRASGPDAIVVRYEEVAVDPAPVIRRLCEKLAIDFEPGMVEYGGVGSGERWAFGDQGTVYREHRPAPEYAGRWRSVLGRSPVWEGWARAYLEALGPELVAELGYDYQALSGSLAAAPPATDWETVTKSDVEAQTNLHSQLERAVATIHEQDRRAEVLETAAAERLETIRQMQVRNAVLEQAAEERLATIHDRDQVISRLQAEIESRDYTIRQVQERGAVLEQAAEERLTEMLKRDEVISRLKAESESAAK
jgi:hypothetical protein